MESRSVYRDNQVIYKDLYYIWTYKPVELCKNFYQQTEKSLYRKHICGIGFYSRFHARHIVSLIIGKQALLHIHIIRGDALIKQGITHLPKIYLDKVFVNSPFTKYGERKLRRWVYPPEFNRDKHRRRHFILYLVRSAEDHGPRAFDRKYKKYFNGYRESITVRSYVKKRSQVFYAFLQKSREALGLPKEGIQYDEELLRAHNKQMRLINRKKNKDNKNSLLEGSQETPETRKTI